MPTYDAEVADDVPYLDVAAVQSADGKTLAFFMVNRHPDEAMSIDIDMAGFAPKAIAEHITIAHPDLKATNTAAKQDRVAPQAGRGDFASATARSKAALPPRSYHWCASASEAHAYVSQSRYIS